VAVVFVVVVEASRPVGTDGTAVGAAAAQMKALYVVQPGTCTRYRRPLLRTAHIYMSVIKIRSCQ
jgi:hypothetical protein